MTDDRSLERAARSWLEEGPTRAPDRPVEAALTRIQTTRQERGLQVPWRFPTMLTNRVAVAALTIVLIIAGGGFALSRLTGLGVGGPSPTPLGSPSSSPIQSSAPTPSAAPLTIAIADVGKTLPAGTYRIEAFAAPFSVTLPAGWTASEFSPNSIVLANASDGTENVYLVVVDKVYLDPCHTEDGPSEIGADVDDLVTAFSSMPDFDVSNLRDATIGGAAGKAFRFSNGIDTAAAGCSGDMLPFGTYDKDGDDVDVAMYGDESDRFWVVNAGGTRVMIAITKVPEVVQATQAVLDSISFGDAPPA